MYSDTRARSEADTEQLLAALRPVADAVRRKKYHTADGGDKPDTNRIELNLSVAECKRIMTLVDAAAFSAILDAA